MLTLETILACEEQIKLIDSAEWSKLYSDSVMIRVFKMYTNTGEVYISKQFLQEQIRYYEEVLDNKFSIELSVKLSNNKFMIEHYDEFVEYCRLKNIVIKESTFLVSGWNCPIDLLYDFKTT